MGLVTAERRNRVLDWRTSRMSDIMPGVAECEVLTVSRDGQVASGFGELRGGVRGAGDVRLDLDGAVGACEVALAALELAGHAACGRL